MKIKIAHTADIHIGFKEKKQNRNFELKQHELKNTFFKILDTCKNQNIDFLLISGDLFNDVNIDSWWESGNIQATYDNERHNLSDGLVICGLNSLNNIIDYDTWFCGHYHSDEPLWDKGYMLYELIKEIF